MERIKPRWFQRKLQTALRLLPAVLTGARQTGKTTLTQAIEPARVYFTLDEVGVLDQAERNPDALLATAPLSWLSFKEHYRSFWRSNVQRTHTNEQATS